ncbi:MAG: flagellar biosynthesis protein FliQ [Oligoflexales bacterium]
MSENEIMNLGAATAMVALKVAAPSLIAIMLMGLVVSIFQAATQINEQTLSFIPKVLAMLGAMLVTGPWVMQTMIFFTREVFQRIALVTQ